jgi:hypothetical protein
MALDQVETSSDEEKVEFEVEDAVEVEVVDDTPEEDRGREPAPEPEDVTDDELEKYSESVQKRIKKFSKGYHDERRAKEAALREREEALRVAQALVEENKRLQGSLGHTSAVSLDQAKKLVANDLATAKAKLKAAHEAFDPDALTEAQVELNRAVLRAERLAAVRPPLQRQENAVQPPQVPPQRTPEPTPDEKALKWKDKNPWFGQDEEKTSFALGLHSKLVKEGVDPQSDEYYARVNQRMKQVFPELSDAEPRQRKSTVAPATRSTAPKKIVLTQTQVNIAKRLGVPLEAYAKQVAEEMRKANG